MEETMPQTLDPESPAWQAATEFHGHACPGLAIGCRMALAACEALGVDTGFLTSRQGFKRNLSPDEELVCVTETDACGLDAVQALLGCTMGKGNLLLKPRGKTAMSFYYRPSGNAVRVTWQGERTSGLSRAEKIRHYLSAPDLVKVTDIPFDPPSRAVVAASLACVSCGELTAEYAIRLRDNHPYCLDCWPDPARIL